MIYPKLYHRTLQNASLVTAWKPNTLLPRGHQLSKNLGTFNWKIWLARRTLEQITFNSLKGVE